LKKKKKGQESHIFNMYIHTINKYYIIACSCLLNICKAVSSQSIVHNTVLNESVPKRCKKNSNESGKGNKAE
jgi:hypothetical protein